MDHPVSSSRTRGSVRVLAGLCVAVLLGACGGGETASSGPTPEPSFPSEPVAQTTEHVSRAESVAPVEWAESPAQAIHAPPPKEGPPPRAPSRPGAAAWVDPSAMGAEPVRFRPHIARRVVATGLSSPTDLAVSADADLIYTERRQGVVVKRASGASAVVWAPAPPAWSAAVTLGSVALDPDFSATRVLYVLLLEPSPGRAKVDLVRLQLKDDLSGVVGQRVVLTTTQAVGDPTPLGESPQMGGKVRVGPDGFLYIGLGDFGSGASPRSPLSLAGTVLRIAANGQPAPGNKAAAGADPSTPCACWSAW
jgi:glucose/arabinose dehydrogenase